MSPLSQSLPAVALAACILSLTAVATGQCGLQWQPGDPIASPVGPVLATTLWDPDGAGPAPQVLVAAGTFWVNTTSTDVATFDGTQWTPLGSSGFTPIRALTVRNNELIAATVSNVYRWTGTTWQPIGTVSGAGGGGIQTMAVFQGDLVVAGAFSQMGAAPAQNIARWNGAAWSGLGSGTNGIVSALAVYTHQLQAGLYVGGAFSSAGGVAVGNLAAWNGSAWAAVATVNGTVTSLGVRLTASASTSYLFVGGSFSAVGAVPAANIARFNSATNTWVALGTGLPSSCQSLFVRGIGQNSYEVIAAAGIVWRLSGSTWISLGDPTGLFAKQALTFYGGRYVVTAHYLGWGGIYHHDGSTWVPVAGVGMSGAGRAVLVTDNDFVMGGWFRSISGVTMNGVARGTSNAWNPLGGGVTGGTGEVLALARLPNGNIVAAGSFRIATGGVADYIAVWDGSAWSPLGGGTDAQVEALLTLRNGDLIAGGQFLNAGTASAPNIARWNGSAWSAVGAGLDDAVRALAEAQNGDLLAGGSFLYSGASSTALNRIARFDGSGWQPLGVGMNGLVRALAVMANGDVVAGGNFSVAGGFANGHLARWSGNYWQSTPLGGVALDQAVRTVLRLPNGDLIVGGERSTVAGVGQDYLFRLRSGAWQRMNASSQVLASALTGSGTVAIAGSFLGGGGVMSVAFARLTPTCPATAVAYGTSCGTNPLEMRVESLPWAGSTYRATVSPITPGAVVFDLLGISALSTPLPQLHPAGVPGCSLLVNSIATQLLLPNNGVVTSQVAIPNTTAFVNLPLFDQVLQVELNAAFAITAMRSSNGLSMRVGAL